MQKCVSHTAMIVLQKTVYIQHICHVMKLLRFNTNISVAKKVRSGSNPPVFKSQTDEMWFVFLRSGREIHLPHWLSLLMARERKGWRRKWCVGVREGHSRPAALRAEEPGSASLRTEPALFSGGQAPSGRGRALCISSLGSFRDRSAY